MVNRALGACVSLVLVAALSGCGMLSQQMESNIDDAFEDVAAQLTMLSVTALSRESVDIATQVSEVSKHKGDANQVEAATMKALQKPDIAQLDKAFLTYQLARCQMFAGHLPQADVTFKQALSLIEALDPKQPDILEAIYYSYSVCLNKFGRQDEAKSYRDKYKELSAARAKKSE